MLYVTTRDSHDAYTAQRALRENRAADGGLYYPFRTPHFSPEEIAALKDKSFGQCMADILNLLFQTRLTGWDVDFAIGRSPVRLVSLGRRILAVETWHNPDWSYRAMERNLFALLTGQKNEVPGDWARIAVRIGMLFGVYGELLRSGFSQKVDISLVSGDFSAPVSAWYAREWGLPIGNIVCCCNENKELWNLICQGQMRTDLLSIPTAVPEADEALPADLERLIFACGGVEEVRRYLDLCRLGRMYCPREGLLSQLRQGLYVSVVSTQRLESTIPNVYRTHDYVLSPCGALAYAGVMDYRAKSGETGACLVLMEQCPINEFVAEALHMSLEQLKDLI